MFQVDVMKYCEGCPETTAQTAIYADGKPAIECPPVIICVSIFASSSVCRTRNKLDKERWIISGVPFSKPKIARVRFFRKVP